MIINEHLFNQLLKDADEEFKGWDFSYLSLSDRMVESPLSWNYTIEIRKRLVGVDSLLDMGTGGGEFLSTLPFPKFTCATESYPPNIIIAKKRLEPLGIKVFPIDSDDSLPFPDNSFQVIINRHESYSPKEVYRILKPGGIFITQQAGGLNDHELNELLEAEPMEYTYWNLDYALEGLSTFEILSKKEDITSTRFYDIGAIIYYLKAIPWQIPDFSVEKYHKQIIKAHNLIQEKHYLDVTLHRFLIVAKK